MSSDCCGFFSRRPGWLLVVNTEFLPLSKPIKFKISSRGGKVLSEAIT